MSNCTDCALHTKCSNPGIPGQALGAAKPSIMVVQDMPTFKDDRSDSVPTLDTKQKILYFLDKAGIAKRDVFFTSAIKCSTKTTGDVKKKHIDVCRNLLLQEINEVRPKMIIAMGKVSNWVLTEHQSIMEFAGHFEDLSFEYEQRAPGAKESTMATFRTKVMPTYGLQASLNKWEYDTEIIRHMKKAVEYLNTGVVPVTPGPVTNVILDLKGLYEFRDRTLAAGEAVTDLETTGFEFFKDKIICAGYCSNDKSADIIFLEPYQEEHIKSFDRENQVRAVQINKFIRAHRAETLEVLREINEEVDTVLHNGKFDAKFAGFNGIPYQRFHADTLVADSLVDENLGHSLNLCYERVGVEFGPYDVALWPYTNKDEKKRKSYQWVPPFLIEKYLGLDVFGIRIKLWPWQQEQLGKSGLTDHFFRRKMPALRMVTASEYVGMKADKRLIVAVSKSITAKQNITLNKIKILTGLKDFNPNSGQQISAYMEENGYPLERLEFPKNATGYSTAGEHLQKLVAIKKYAEFPKLILDFKKLAKIQGTYVAGTGKKAGIGGMLQFLDPSHRIHTNFNLWTPRTSRWSANRPSVQVWPRPLNGLPNARNFIIPRDSWNLFEFDYRGLEQYIVAALSKDKVLIKLLQDGTDVHSYNATSLGKKLGLVAANVTYEMFLDYIGKGSIKKEDIESQPELKKTYLIYSDLRTKAKSIGFGLNYGKGAISFAEEFGIDQEAAQDMIDAYFVIYSEMLAWRNKIVRQALVHGEIKLPSGRPRRFHAAKAWLDSEFSKSTWSAKRLREEIARQAMNYPVQGGAHEVFEPACIRLDRRFKAEGLRARMGFFIHDGVLGECPREENQKVLQCIKEEAPFTFYAGTKLELKLDVDVDFYESCWYGNKQKIEESA
jgi:uracil-DNA glycosylase family 4